MRIHWREVCGLLYLGFCVHLHDEIGHIEIQEGSSHGHSDDTWYAGIMTAIIVRSAYTIMHLFICPRVKAMREVHRTEVLLQVEHTYKEGKQRVRVRSR